MERLKHIRTKMNFGQWLGNASLKNSSSTVKLHLKGAFLYLDHTEIRNNAKFRPTLTLRDDIELSVGSCYRG